MLELFVTGFSAIFTWQAIGMIVLGVTVGIVFGAIPGLTTTMAVALCTPLTFGMDTVISMSLLMGIYIGGTSGGLISAILLRIPGTPAAVATCWDGNPLAMKGEAGKALGVAILYSFIGGLFSFLVLIFVAPPLANIALSFGPYEFFAISVFSLTMISGLAGDSLAKGFATGLLGFVLSFVGMAPIDAFPRFTFGYHELDNGFDILPVLIGLFAVSEILKTASAGCENKKAEIAAYSIKGFGISLAEFLGQTWNMLRSAAIGIFIGILPGIGSATSNILAYVTAKNQSKNSEKFGTGIIDGIVASETSACATIGGDLIPTLTLGIPGDTVTAMLIGAFMIHGISPGPLLFINNANIVYGIFAALLVANVVMLLMEYYGLRVFVKLLRIPKYILLPVILTLCVVGAYGLNNRLFDVWSLLFFGVLGYVLEKFKYPVAPIILGFILGPMAETNLLRSMQFSNGSFMPFLTRPIALGLLMGAVISLVAVAWKNYQKKKSAGVQTIGV